MPKQNARARRQAQDTRSRKAAPDADAHRGPGDTRARRYAKALETKPVVCEYCGTDRLRVTRTVKTRAPDGAEHITRYVKCRRCHHNQKLIEIRPPAGQAPAADQGPPAD